MNKGTNLRWYIDNKPITGPITDTMTSNENPIKLGKSFTLDISEQRWEYYMKRKNTYYFRKGVAKIEIEPIEANKEMSKLKYGDMIEIDYSVE